MFFSFAWSKEMFWWKTSRILLEGIHILMMFHNLSYLNLAKINDDLVNTCIYVTIQIASDLW